MKRINYLKNDVYIIYYRHTYIRENPTDKFINLVKYNPFAKNHKFDMICYRLKTTLYECMLDQFEY